MRGRTLPSELFDYIIDFLYDDRTALKHTSLVARAWVPTSRHHLFYRVTLCAPLSARQDAETACARLHAAIQDMPVLAMYIREVIICDESPRGMWMWVPREPELPLLLEKLVNLNVLEMGFPTGTWVFDNVWPRKVLKFIGEAVVEKPIKELRLRNFCFTQPQDLMWIIGCCGGLRALKMDNLEFVSWTERLSPELVFREAGAGMGWFAKGKNGSENEVKASPEMMTLETRMSSLILDCFMHPKSPITLSGFRHLDLKILKIPDHFATYAELFKSTPLLESLEIELTSTVDFDAHWTLSNPVDLGHLRSLRSLTLKVEILLGRSDPLPWLITLFSSIVNDNTLESISIISIIDHPPPYVTMGTYNTCLVNWRRLDRLLTQPQFHNLKRLRLDFEFDDPFHDRSMTRIWEDIMLQLPLLNSSGVLQVDATYL